MHERRKRAKEFAIEQMEQNLAGVRHARQLRVHGTEFVRVETIRFEVSCALRQVLGNLKAGDPD